MRPELKKAMEERLAELEPEAARLWEDYKQAKEALKPKTDAINEICVAWNEKNEEARWLKRQLGIKP